MDYFAGLDVSVCIVNDTGRIIRKVKVLKNPAYHFKRMGLEAAGAREDGAQWRRGTRLTVPRQAA